MAHVGIPSFRHWVVVLINDSIEVLCHLVCRFVKELVIKYAIDNVLRQRNGRQITYRYLIRCRVLHDLCAEVGRANCSQVFLVGFAVTGVLVKHVRRSRLNLRFQNLGPQLTCLDDLFSLTSFFVTSIHLFKVVTIGVVQPRALVRAKQRPIGILLDPLHEEIRNPHGIEQVTCTRLLIAGVFLQVQEVKNVCMPWLEIHGKGSLALAATLVHITGGVIEHTQHGNQAIGCAVGASNIRSLGAHIVQAQANATSALADFCTLFECVINAINAIVLHLQKEAARHLWLRCSRIEQGGCGMGVQPF